MNLLGKSWKYINEGNAHIVVHVSNTDYVLRLIKEDGKSKDIQHVEQSVNFVNLVMLPLISDDINAEDEVIKISKEELSRLSRDLFGLRPEKRRFKSVLSPYAIKTCNLTILSPKCMTNYCVEIKPKEGFISSSLGNSYKCYYCLKQYLKLQSKEIDKVSHYCPLDFFSGEKQRIKFALLNLVNNPQNNFKIFKDGSLIYHEKSDRNSFEKIINNMNCFKTSNLFLDFIVKILINVKNESNILGEENDILEYNGTKCNQNCNLQPNTFLYRLLQLQKLSETIQFGTTDILIKDIQYVSIILEQIKSLNLNLSLENDRELFLKTLNPQHLALMSAVFKDCSIMISFSLNSHDGFPYIQVGDQKASYKIAATDLEPKSAKSLVKRKETERKMIEIYRKMH